MISIRQERKYDFFARETLLDAAFGAVERMEKTSEKLREGRLPAEGLSFVATDRGNLVGTVRLWHVSAGADRPALLLGPLAVSEEARGRGIGGALMNRALAEAYRRGHAAVILVGDAPYYGRFGFSGRETGNLFLPGPFERHRLLGCELREEALAEARGLVVATGRRRPAGLRDAPDPRLSRAA